MGLKLNGATSGSIEIDVPAVAGTDTAITIPATTGGEFIVSDSSGNIDLGPLDINGGASDDSVNIDGSGRLLVGTTTHSISSSQRFEVKGGSALFYNDSDNVSPLYIKNDNADSGSGAWRPFLVMQDASANRGGLFMNDSDQVAISGQVAVSFLTGNTAPATERFRIDNNGYIMLGGGGEGSNGTLTCYPNSSFGAPYLRWQRNPTTDGSAAAIFRNGTTQVGSITFGDSSTAFNTSSDYRLKENVVDLEGAITRVKQLAPKRFNFIVNAEKTVDGFLAHEAQVVVPEAVFGTKDEVEVWQEGEELPDNVSVGDNKLDEDGNTIPVYQGIDQSKLVPLLTAALQEAIAKIETLEAKVAQLEGGAA